MKTFEKLWREETGLVLSAELVLVLTIGVLAMVVGLNAVASSLNQELNDIAGAFGAIDQTYQYSGFINPSNFGGTAGIGFGGSCAHAFVAGSGYVDTGDFCDCSEIVAISGGVKGDVGSGAESASGATAVGGTGTAVGTSSNAAVESSSTPVEECSTCED